MLKMFRITAVIAFVVMTMVFLTSSAEAGPCRSNSWQPTFVHDLIGPDGPYYVNPGGATFVKLAPPPNTWVRQACNLIQRSGLRDRRGFTTCQAYTRVQCGCDAASRVNSTCANFLRFKGR